MSNLSFVDGLNSTQDLTTEAEGNAGTNAETGSEVETSIKVPEMSWVSQQVAKFIEAKNNEEEEEAKAADSDAAEAADADADVDDDTAPDDGDNQRPDDQPVPVPKKKIRKVKKKIYLQVKNWRQLINT